MFALQFVVLPMNPNDHHGGGEGKAPVGRKGAIYSGKPALGVKLVTRKRKSDKLIVRRRNQK